MHTACPMGDGQPTFAVQLAELAAHGRLTIYTGAGLSLGAPSDIPDGAEVARRCHARLVASLGAKAFKDVDKSDLVAVADAMASLENGLDLVRRTAVGVADFTTAIPNLSHEILALLLLEGVVTAITTNWDDCIERAGGEERVMAVISDQDRQELPSTALFKVHGCATRPASALITTEDLSNPPHWARDEVRARLADSHTVFVGIGDIAGYVRERIAEARAAIGGDGAIYVVSPGIRKKWTTSDWAAVIPELPEARRLAVSSDQFLDHLAGASIRLALQKTAEALEDEPGALEAYNFARTALDSCTSLDMLRWLRSCAVNRKAGSSVTREQAFSHALIALGVLGGSDVVVKPGGRAIAAGREFELLVAVGTVSASRFRRESAARLTKYRSEGMSSASEPAFLVAGSFGSLHAAGGTVGDVLDDSPTNDLVAGPLVVSPQLVRAEDYAA